jgi:hypothetical protein
VASNLSHADRKRALPETVEHGCWDGPEPDVTELSLQKGYFVVDCRVEQNTMRNKKFVGPDGKTYLEHKPEEGSFLTYFDGSTWLITFPSGRDLDRSYYFYGDRLPVTSRDWRISHVGKPSPFPAFVES